MGPLAKRFLWLAPLALTGVAFALRASGQAEVFSGAGFDPIGGEAWYHLRRQVFGIVNAPALLGFDPYLRFSHGSVPPLAPGFDALIGWLAAFAGPGERIAAAERLGSWAPVLCGALCVLLVFAVLWKRFGATAACVGAGLLVVLPVHIVATQAGYVTQRAAGALMSVAVLALALPLLREAEGSRLAKLVRPLALGAASAFALWVSMLAWLPVVLVHAVLFGHALTRDSAGAARACMTRLVLVEGVAAAGVALFAWASPHSTADLYSWLHPSRLHVVAFAGWFALAAVLAGLWRSALGASLGRRLACLVVVGTAIDASLYGLLPGLRGAVSRWSDPFAGDPSIHATQLEPALGSLSSVGALATLASGFAPALPVLLVLTLALAWRRRERAEAIAVVVFAAGCAGLAWSAPGAHALAGIAVALGVGCACGAILQRIEAHWAPALIAVAALLVAAPVLQGAATATTREPGVVVGQARLDGAVVHDVFDWLQREGRPGGKWLAADSTPSYSVLAPWELGHQLLYEAQRAPVIDGFYPLLAPGRRQPVADVYRLPAHRTARTLDRFAALYVVVPDVPGFPDRSGPGSGLVAEMLERDGSEPADPAEGGFAISNLRLVYEHGERDAGGAMRVYEHVRGARVSGAAMPERLIRFSLRLRTRAGREFTYRVSTYTDPYWGNYEVRLPYSTLETKRESYVEAIGSWQVECLDEVVTLDVPDWKVRDGAQVVAPGFCY